GRAGIEDVLAQLRHRPALDLLVDGALHVVQDEARHRILLVWDDRILEQVGQQKLGQHQLGRHPLGRAVGDDAGQPVARFLLVGFGHHLLDVAERISLAAQRSRKLHAPAVSSCSSAEGGVSGVSGGLLSTAGIAMRKASSKTSFSARVPIVMRRQPSSGVPARSKFLTSTPCSCRVVHTRVASGTLTITKLALDGNTVAPAAASSADTRSRSATTSSTPARSRPAWCVSSHTAARCATVPTL